MNLKRTISLISTITMLSGAAGVMSVSAEDTLYSAKFDFGAYEKADGYTQITSKDVYSAEKGYGFTDTSSLKDGGKDVIGDYVTSSNNEFTFEVDVPDGDYEVKITNGGDTQTEANIYINDGERVRVFTVEADNYQENTQRVLPKDGKITFTFKGTDVKTNAIEITQLEAREKEGEKPTIYIAGDSTAQTYNAAKTYPQTGWGQVIGDYFTDDVIIENRSMGGRSLKSYNNDGRLDNILTSIKPGDYLLIQFGHNDGSSKPERFISVDDFKKLMADKYVAETVKRGAIPIIMSPTPHYSPDENGKFAPTIINYADAAKEVAQNTNTLFLDIQQKIADRWNELGADKVKKFYFINEKGESVAYPDGTDDHTHFKEAGAREVAQIITTALSENVDKLSPYAYTEKNAIKFDDVKGHWSEDLVNEAVNRHIVNGVSKTEFEPEREVTRAEFVSFIMRANGINGKAWRNGECYSDVKEDDWFRFDLQGAMDKGIIPEEMVTDNKFNPNENITREEMAAILVRAYEYANADIKQDFSNVILKLKDSDDVSEWANTYITKAFMYGLMQGSEDTDGKMVIKPKDNATRAEAAAVVVRCVAE